MIIVVVRVGIGVVIVPARDQIGDEHMRRVGIAAPAYRMGIDQEGFLAGALAHLGARLRPPHV